MGLAACWVASVAGDAAVAVGELAELPSIPFRSLVSNEELGDAKAAAADEQLALLPLEHLATRGGVQATRAGFSAIPLDHLESSAAKHVTGLTVSAAAVSGEPVVDDAALMGPRLPLLLRFWERLRDSFSFEPFIKVVCTISNVLNHASAYPAIRRIRLEQDTGAIDAAPFLGIMVNCSQWIFYGILAWHVTHAKGFLVAVYSNLFGMCAGTYYVCTYHRFCIAKASIERLHVYYWIVLFVLSAHVGLVAFLGTHSALIATGFLVSVCGALCNTFQLSTLGTVLQTRSTASMNLYFSMGSLLSAVMWLACGITIRDWWIVAPNVVGLAASVTALTTIFVLGPANTEVESSGAKVLNERTPLVHKIRKDSASAPEAFQTKKNSPFSALLEVKAPHLSTPVV